jgi:hypothetical protein
MAITPRIRFQRVVAGFDPPHTLQLRQHRTDVCVTYFPSALAPISLAIFGSFKPLSGWP